MNFSSEKEITNKVFTNKVFIFEVSIFRQKGRITLLQWS